MMKLFEPNKMVVEEEILDLEIKKRDDWVYSIYKTGVACSTNSINGQGREEIICWFSPKTIKMIEEIKEASTVGNNNDCKLFISENGYLSLQTVVKK